MQKCVYVCLSMSVCVCVCVCVCVSAGCLCSDSLGFSVPFCSLFFSNFLFSHTCNTQIQKHTPGCSEAGNMRRGGSLRPQKVSNNTLFFVSTVRKTSCVTRKNSPVSRMNAAEVKTGRFFRLYFLFLSRHHVVFVLR